MKLKHKRRCCWYPDLENEMDALKKFMIVLNDADKYPTEHELAEAALVARDKLNHLVEQRYATLRLAKELHQQKAHTYASENADLYRGFDNGCKYAANRINKIFSPKDGSEKQAHDKRDKQI